jgi:hypothetical protein
MCEITNELQLKHMWGNETSIPGRDQLSMSFKLELNHMSYVHKLLHNTNRLWSGSNSKHFQRFKLQLDLELGLVVLSKLTIK